MSHIPSPNGETFTFIHSEEDHQEILAFIKQNERTVERLLDVITNARGTVEDGVYTFEKSIHLVVDAERFIMSRKEPKPKRTAGGGYRITFEIRSRNLVNVAAPTLVLATAVGCMRIRDAIRGCNLIAKTGQDARDILNQMVGVFIDQIESAAHYMSMDVTLH